MRECSVLQNITQWNELRRKGNPKCFRHALGCCSNNIEPYVCCASTPSRPRNETSDVQENTRDEEKKKESSCNNRRTLTQTDSSTQISPTFSSLSLSLFFEDQAMVKSWIILPLWSAHTSESSFPFLIFFFSPFLSVRVPASRFTLVCKCAGIG